MDENELNDQIQEPLTLNDPRLVKPEIDDNYEKKLVHPAEILPTNLPLIAVNQAVIFPGMVVPMVLSQDKHKNTISYLMDQKDGVSQPPYLGIIVAKDSNLS